MLFCLAICGANVSMASSPQLSRQGAMNEAKASVRKLRVSVPVLRSAQVGVHFRAALRAEGGHPEYKWSLVSGRLPAGLQLARETGIIAGTPTSAGDATFDVQVADSSLPVQTEAFRMSLTVNSALDVSTTALPGAQVGVSYSAALQATGGTPGYLWSLQSGSLPAGLSLSGAGVLSGTPTTSGKTSLVVKVTEERRPTESQTAVLLLTIAPPALRVTSASLAEGQQGKAYAASLQVQGGTPGYLWSVASGSLPTGLNLSAAGTITGTPTTSGIASFTVQVTDSGSPAQSQRVPLTLTVDPPPLAIESSNVPSARVGATYTATLQANGGTPGYSWTVVSGRLPAGLSLSSAGAISGTPTAAGSSSFSAMVTDSSRPALSQVAVLSLTVAAPILAIPSTALTGGQCGTSYSASLTATGGTPGYTWTVASGNLPAGLSLSRTGVISGTPTAAGTSGFAVQVTDAGSPAQIQTASLSLTVAPPTLTIGAASFANGQSGTAYTASLLALGGTPGYTWTLQSGSLPAGLSLSSAGAISGTPTSAGISSFTVAVADSGLPAQSAILSSVITITAPPAPPASAAKIYLYPTAPVAPRGSYQTVTAVVTGSNDKTVTWTSDGGTIVGTNPCVVNEPCTVALYTTEPGTYHLTATSNAHSFLVASSTVTFTGSPTPVTSHPRLGGITASMLPELQSKAVASNPLYAALFSRAVTAYNNDNALWAWSCNGGSGQPSSDQTENYKEGDSYLFAFMSMIDPNNSTYKWGCYGRDIWIYYANFWLNPLNASYTAATLSQRQVDAQYGLTGNHGADSTESLTLTPDWLMAGGYLNASDLETTRAYFALAGKQMINIAFTGSRAPVGGYNSAAQFNTGSVFDFVGERAMGNNYTHSKILFLTAAALTFNDTATDDPAIGSTCNATRYLVCPDGSSGSLHAYWTYLSGGMLYKDWAHLEEPSVTLAAYKAAYGNPSTAPQCQDSTSGKMVSCLGDGRGGESSEGSWYQYSLYRLQLAMVSIASAGYADPIQYGPQMSLATSSWWDMKSVSDVEFLTYSYYTPQPRFSFLSTGDTLNLYRMPADFNAEAWMMVNDSRAGRTDRTALLEWPLVATSVGGVGDFYANLGNDYASNNAVPLFVALPASDPAANPPADPRPNLPTDLYSGGNQHILVRSGWDQGGTESASWGDGGTNTEFSFYCANTRIDHEHETCGGFDVLSDGEYITKTRTVFNNYNMMLATAEHSNEAGFGDGPQSTCTQAGGCFEWQAVQGSDGNGGGQLWHGYQAGTVTLAHAELPAYVAAIVDTTNLYNGSAAVGWGGIGGVTAASRSLLYLRGSNQVIYYDRGAGGSSARLWATTTGPVSVAAGTASWPTRSGKQEVYLTSLLPATAAVSDAGAYQTNENGASGTSDWEPYSHVLIDAGNPAAVQFLSVMEWGGKTFAKSQTTLVQSTQGQNFDGARVGSTLVMFFRNWPAVFTGTTYPASGATTQYLSDLVPNTVYAITGVGVPATATTDNAGVLSFSAAGSGQISIAPVL